MISSLLCILLLFAASTATPQSQTQSSDPQELLKQSDEAFTQQRYSDTAKALEQALTLYEQQNDPKGMALAAFKLGKAYSKLSRFTDADRALHQAMKLHQELGDQPAIGDDLTQLAFIAAWQSAYDKSLELSNQALAIHQTSGNKKGLADTYRNIGYVYQFTGDNEKATDFTQRSLNIATEIGDKDGQAGSWSNLGAIQWRLSNFDQALEHYQKGLALAMETGNKRTQSHIIGDMALIDWNRGHLSEALESFQRSLALGEEIDDRQGVAINLFNIGSLRSDLEEYGEAQDALQKAMDMAKEIGDRGLESACLDALGQLHRYLGDYDIALDQLQKAAAIAEEIHEKRTLAYELKSLASLYESRGKFTEALASDQKALALYEELKEKRGIAVTSNDLGEMYISLHKYKEALPLYQRALAIGNELKSSFILDDTYLGLGWIYYTSREMKEAEEAFTKSEALARETERPQSIWQALYGRSLVYRETDRKAEAAPLMKEAVDLIEKARNEVPLAEQRAGYLEHKLDVYEDLIGLLVAQRNSSGAFEYAQRAKARSFLDLLTEARINPEGTAAPELQERKKKLLKSLGDTQREIENESESDAPDREKIAQLAKKRNQLEADFDNLKIEIRKQIPRLADLEYQKPLGLEEAQRLTEEDSVLLEYFLGNTRSFVFVITRTGADVYPLPAQDEIAKRVRGIREALTKPELVYQSSEGSYTKYILLAHELYKDLIAAAASTLKGKQRIVIAPDGILNYLPFECLLRKAPPAGNEDFRTLPYLALDFEIQYVPSASVLAAINANKASATTPNQKDLAAFADPSEHPVLTAQAGKLRGASGEYPPLPNARLEVQQIARLFPPANVAVFEGQDASELKVKEAKLEQYKRLHFASHGVVDEERPEFSALVLNARGGEDGFLTMREVFDLRLNADLVVLSACSTGLGQRIRGEGVMGLSRAFLCAGASSVLSSLWNVYDQSTAAFMTAFYTNLKSDRMSKAAALKRARLALIRSKDYSHPYYWAPFVLIGNQ